MADDQREFTERWRLRLLAAQTDLIDAYGGCKRVVDRCSVSRSQVGRWYGGIERDAMPVPIIMALEGYAGRPIVSAIMVEFLGMEIAWAIDGHFSTASLSALSADLVAATSHMMVETVRAKADGVVTPTEARQLRAVSRDIEKIRAEIDDRLAMAEAREMPEGA